MVTRSSLDLEGTGRDLAPGPKFIVTFDPMMSATIVLAARAVYRTRHELMRWSPNLNASCVRCRPSAPLDAARTKGSHFDANSGLGGIGWNLDVFRSLACDVNLTKEEARLALEGHCGCNGTRGYEIPSRSPHPVDNREIPSFGRGLRAEWRILH